MNVAGKTVIIIGDSLSAKNGAYTYTPDTNVNRYGSPGDFFGAALRRAGAQVVVNAKVGRSAHSFFTQEGGDQVLVTLQQYDPDVVFVLLGTNDLGLDLSVDGEQMARIRDAFPAAEVWAIGPPTLSRATDAAAVVQMMQRVFPHFVDLRRYTRDTPPGSSYRSPDGVHFTAPGARLIADRLAQLFVAKNHVGLKVGAATLAFTAFGLGLSFIIARRNELRNQQ